MVLMISTLVVFLCALGITMTSYWMILRNTWHIQWIRFSQVTAGSAWIGVVLLVWAQPEGAFAQYWVSWVLLGVLCWLLAGWAFYRKANLPEGEPVNKTISFLQRHVQERVARARHAYVLILFLLGWTVQVLTFVNKLSTH